MPSYSYLASSTLSFHHQPQRDTASAIYLLALPENKKMPHTNYEARSD